MQYLKQTNIQILLLLVISHIISTLSFGSTFWIDAQSYVEMAQRLMLNRKEFSDEVDTTLRWWGAYQPFGLSYLWLLLSYLPTNFVWVVFVFFQRGISLISTFLLWREINIHFPTKFNLFFLALLLFNPFYQTYHNSLMTESISSSLICLLAYLTLNFYKLKEISNFKLLLFCVSIFILSQFRTYLIIPPALWIFVFFLKKRKVFSKYSLASAIVVVFSFYSLPIIRYLKSGIYYNSNLGIGVLYTSLQFNTSPGEKSINAISSIAPSIKVDTETINNFSFDTISTIAMNLKKNGLSSADVVKKMEEAALVIGYENTSLIYKRIEYGIISSGFYAPYIWSDDTNMFSRNYTKEAHQTHQINHTNWTSWLVKDENMYAEAFEKWFNTNNIARQYFYKSWKPYLKLKYNKIRDPIKLSKVWPDIWSILGLISSLVLLLNGNIRGLIPVSVMGITFLAAFTAPFADLRYSYCSLPLNLAYSGYVAYQLKTFLKTKFRINNRLQKHT